MPLITLREYSESDLERIVLLANNENVARYLADTFPHPYTRSHADWWVHTGSKEPGAITRVVEYQGIFVGGVGVHRQDGWRDHIGAIGYWLAEDYWGKGIATAAVIQMTHLAFATAGIRKLCAQVLAPNVASMRVLEKAGYSREALLEAEVHKDGVYFDTHLFVRHHRPPP